MQFIQRWQLLLAFFTGASMVLSFAPFSVYPLSIIALAAFFYLLLQAQSTKAHWLITWWFSAGFFLSGIHWIYFSIHFFNHAHWLLAGTITIAFCLFIASLVLPFALITQFFRQSNRIIQLLLVFPAAWVMVEGFRGWIFTGFPWLLIGQAQIDNVFAHIAPITGVFGVSWLVAVLAGLLTLLIIGTRKDRIFAASLALVLLVSSFALSFIQWTHPTGEAIKVSLLQGNIPQEKKWKPDYYQPTLDIYQQLTEQSWDSDLIIWPETAIPGYFASAAEEVIEPLRVQALMEKSALLIGGFYYDFDTEVTYNSVLSIDNKEGSAIYAKRHLVPFSEYFPFLGHLEWLREWIQLPYDSVGQGTGSNTLRILNMDAQISICYEDVYGNEIIDGLPKAKLLVNLSNDGWFTGSIEPAQHMQIARMRALETGRYLLRATNNGVSGIIDHKGQLISTADQYIQTTIKGEAQPFAGETPYVRWGNGFIFAVLAFILVMSGLLMRKKSKPADH